MTTKRVTECESLYLEDYHGEGGGREDEGVYKDLINKKVGG